MGTKLTELRDGCFHAAMDDEPIFVLLARDADAPRVVRNWAAAREDDINKGRRPASDRDKVADARATADKMERWRKEHDGEWRGGLFARDESVGDAEAQPLPGEPFTMDYEGVRYQGMFGGPVAHDAMQHHVRQESDEYACSCGKRWDVAEGEDHP